MLRKMRNTIRGAVITLIVFCTCAAFGQMPGMGPMFGPEALEYMNHKIDMDSVEKAFQSTTALSKLAKDKPEIKDKVKFRMGPGQRPGGGQAPKMPSIDEMVSGIKAYPEAVSAIESSGLSVEEYLKTTYSLIYGWMMLQMDKRGMLDQMLGIFIPLIATNCAVLGVALLNVQEADGFLQSVFYGFGAAGGFALVLTLFAAIRERVEAADLPRAFRGTAIALMTAGIMSLAFMGFSGMARL